METANRLYPKALGRLLLSGIAVAFAVFALTFIFGLSTASAHADDSDGEGLSGIVSGLVDDTTSVVESTVTTVQDAATTVAEQTTAPLPEPVRAPAQKATTAVTAVVAEVVAPLPKQVSTEVVAPVVEQVVDVVEEAPVIGNVIDELGVTDILKDVVDDTQGVIDVIEGPLEGSPPDVERPTLDTPAALPTLTSGGPAVEGTAARADAGDSAPFAAVGAFAAYTPSASITAPDAGASSAAATNAPPPFLAELSPPGSAATGSGGAGPAAWALAGLLPFAAHRAWVRRPGPEDHRAPDGPADRTDTSPD